MMLLWNCASRLVPASGGVTKAPFDSSPASFRSSSFTGWTPLADWLECRIRIDLRARAKPERSARHDPQRLQLTYPCGLFHHPERQCAVLPQEQKADSSAIWFRDPNGTKSPALWNCSHRKRRRDPQTTDEAGSVPTDRSIALHREAWSGTGMR